MNTPHKNAEVIKAWADGKQIQWRTKAGGWHDFVISNDCGPWVPGDVWRIKPQKRELWVNVNASGWACVYSSREAADEMADIEYRIACVHVEYEEGEGL